MLNQCTSCYAVTLLSCTEKINVEAGLQAATDYTYRITDKFGNRFNQVVTTDEEGTFSIEPKNHLPGLFTPYSGAFKVEVFKEGNCEPGTMTFWDEEYKCILIDFANGEAQEQTIKHCND